MKTKLFAVLFTALAFLVAPIVHAQQYQALGGLASTLAAATQTNFASPPLIDAHAQDKVGFTFNNTWSTAGGATGLTNISYTLAPTDDMKTYSTNNGLITLNAYNWTAIGNTSTSTTNLNANGHNGWFVISATNNSATGVATNLANAFLYSVKVGAP